MKPLQNIDTRETGMGSAGDTVCLSPGLPAPESGLPFPPVPNQRLARGPSVPRRLMRVTSTNTGYFDAGLATPPERERFPGANDKILHETGEMQ